MEKEHIKKPIILGVAGGSASGKTEISKYLLNTTLFM
jgi:uridine kinase